MSRTLVAALLAAALTAVPLALATSPAAAQTTTTDAGTQAKPKRALSAGQQAMHERQKKCGAEWKAAKAAGKVEKGMTWPKYWSACNKRLKAGG
jgi:hypothetical protein